MNELNKKAAQRRIDNFESYYKTDRLNLACHAALPMALTPDLLYGIWSQFYTDSPAWPDWIGVADVLLSRLCTEVSYELYELDTAVRDLLLQRLEQDFGRARVQELARFVVGYVEREQNHPLKADFAEAQRWIALAYFDPNQVVTEINQALQQPDEDEHWRILHLQNLFPPDLRPRLEKLIQNPFSVLNEKEITSTTFAENHAVPQTHIDTQSDEKKYQALFEELKDVVFIIDTNMKIVDISPACEILLGYTRSEMRQMNLLDYISHDDRLGFQTKINQQNLVNDFAISFHHQDGSKRDCLITATSQQSNEGLTLGYQGTIRDITKNIQHEQELILLSSLQRELSIALEIQDSLLPPTSPNWPDLDLACYTKPARQVGGDFYIYHHASSHLPNHIAAIESPLYTISVGDVSGKGVSASLLMAISLASFRAIVEQNLSPSELLQQMDKAIANYTHTNRQNCALVCVQIELKPNDQVFTSHYAILRVANAGCVVPIVKYADGNTQWVDVGGMPLGISLEAKLGYQEITLGLSKGDIIVLTSDGVVEAKNIQDELFGFDGLEQAVLNGSQESAEAMLNCIKQEVTSFIVEREQHDDLTIVVVQI